METKSPRKCGLLRVVTQKCAKVRTDQGRGYAMLRIVTGGTFFSRKRQFVGTDSRQNQLLWAAVMRRDRDEWFA